MTRPNRRRPRRAFTLFEMVLVIGGASIVLGLAAGTLILLFRLDFAGRSSLNDAAALPRLARQFRNDVRSAEAAEPAAEGAPPRLTLKNPAAHDVSYQPSGDRLLRTETEAGLVVRRESYDVARLGPAAFEAEGPFVRLVLPRRPDRAGVPGRLGVRIDARLGKDRDLTGPSGAKK